MLAENGSVLTVDWLAEERDVFGSGRRAGAACSPAPPSTPAAELPSEKIVSDALVLRVLGDSVEGGPGKPVAR